MLLREDFSSEEIREALQSEADRSILKRCKLRREAFDRLEKWYDPESEVTTQKLYDRFHDFMISPNGNSIEALHELEDTNNEMSEKGMIILQIFLHARLLRVLPDEYGHVKATLQAMKNRDRVKIIRRVGTRYSTLPQKKKLQRSSRPPDQAFFSRESGGQRGARRGRGRGGNSNKDGSSSSGGGSSSASSASGSSHGGGSRPHSRCW